MLGQALNPQAQPGGCYVVMASRAQMLARSTAPQKIFITVTIKCKILTVVTGGGYFHALPLALQ